MRELKGGLFEETVDGADFSLLLALVVSFDSAVVVSGFGIGRSTGDNCVVSGPEIPPAYSGGAATTSLFGAADGAIESAVKLGERSAEDLLLFFLSENDADDNPKICQR